jgi:hypothetical protein
MDTKITLSFDAAVIEKAKKYAKKNNMSLSRLTEYLLRQITSNHYKTLEEFPISDWVNQVAEGEAEYLIKPRGRKAIKSEYYESRS